MCRKRFDVKSTNVLLREKQRPYFLIRAGLGLNGGELNMLSLPLTSPLVGQFYRSTGFAIRELVHEKCPFDEARLIEDEMLFLHAAVSVPLYYRGKVEAILNVGQKLNGGRV